MSNSTTARVGLFGIAFLVLLLDRATKLLVASRIALNTGSITVIPEFFSITHVENSGAAFSLLANAAPIVRMGVLISFSALAMVVVAWLLWQHGTAYTLTTTALAMVLGGAVGNLWDRILRHHVTDFLHFYVGDWSWPDFNVADSAIVVGACLLIAEIVFGKSAKTVEE